MSLTCQCPSAAAIANVPNVTCPENFGQIQKIAFQRLNKQDGTKNSFTTSDDIKQLASWQEKLSAADGTKIVVTPYVNAPADSGGDARTTSGGNDDLGGIAQVIGSEPVQFSAVIRSVPQSVIKALKTLMCEANVQNLGVYLFDENGNIEAIQDETTPTTYYPIPISGLFVGDKIHGNYDAKDSNALSFSYKPGYSDNLAIVDPEFNPLTDLQNSEA